MGGLVGKTAIVTGGSRGIGRAIAERLARDGAAVAIGYRARDAAAAAAVEAIRAAGGHAIAVRADAGDVAAIRHLFDEAAHNFGPPDIVVANAGSLVAKPLAEATLQDFEAGFMTNARGTFLTFSEAARRIRDGGRIIGLSSVLVRIGRPGIGLYTASKAAIEQFAHVLARELGPRGITVNVVAPGATDTEMLPETSRRTVPQMTPLGRIGRPDDIADVVAFLASEAARWISGQVIGANGGIA